MHKHSLGWRAAGIALDNKGSQEGAFNGLQRAIDAVAQATHYGCMGQPRLVHWVLVVLCVRLAVHVRHGVGPRRSPHRCARHGPAPAAWHWGHRQQRHVCWVARHQRGCNRRAWLHRQRPIHRRVDRSLRPCPFTPSFLLVFPLLRVHLQPQATVSRHAPHAHTHMYTPESLAPDGEGRCTSSGPTSPPWRKQAANTWGSGN